jgi:hypothetical protein
MRFKAAAVLLAFAPVLVGGCAKQVADLKDKLSAALSSPDAKTAENFVITDGGVLACSYAVSHPPVNPGPITATTYRAFVDGCDTPPTDLASANAFLTNLAVAYIEARLLSK